MSSDFMLFSAAVACPNGIIVPDSGPLDVTVLSAFSIAHSSDFALQTCGQSDSANVAIAQESFPLTIHERSSKKRWE